VSIENRLRGGEKCEEEVASASILGKAKGFLKKGN